MALPIPTVPGIGKLLHHNEKVQQGNAFCAMTIISALFGTIIFIVTFELLGKDLFYLGSMELKARFYIFFIFAYLITLVVGGWRYAVQGKRLSGIIHAWLMSGISGLGLVSGLLTWSGRANIIGGSGPDANPVAPEIFLVGLIAAIVGGIAAICATGIFWKLYSKRN